ncbi:MAG TPA: glycosyltransferase family 39 protein, partial [Anaerolineae bacterium]|nr:glycosyltransferase family 39 protein [Anaerolineae bacterium]
MKRCENCRFYLELGIICLLAFALRLHLLEDVSLHDDEARSVSLYIRQPVSHIFINYIPNNHWLSNILGYGMAQLGQSRFLLRWPSLICGVLSIPLLACTGYRLFRNRRLGLSAAWLLCLSAFHIQWSQQFRGYSPLLFFSLLSCYWLYEALKTGSQRSWYSFLIAAFLSLLSHLYGALMLVPAVIMVGLRYRRFQAKLHLLILLPILVLLGYLLWFGKIYIIDLLHPPLKVSLVQVIQYQYLAFWPTLS